MAIKLNDKFLTSFIRKEELANMQSAASSAYELLLSKKGPGSDFLGWVDLPVNYDKAEFSAIKAAAEKIKKSCDILVVIGIGGSYLGARAAIEFVKSPLYNNLKKDTPDIYFAGNNISPTALSELISICEGKDICVNVISKSGTTTEPAVAFRVFKAMLTEKYDTPSDSQEKFTGYVGDNHNGLIMHALKAGEYVWYTTFTTELGDIELSIMAGTEYDTACVRLSYYDKANAEKVRNAAIDDL